MADLAGCSGKEELLGRLREYADLNPQRVDCSFLFDVHYGEFITRED